jgi:hypothetical protein
MPVEFWTLLRIYCHVMSQSAFMNCCTLARVVVLFVLHVNIVLTSCLREANY